MREYVHQQTAVLLRRLAFQMNRAAKSGDAESIHDLRVAIRRLSGCLNTFAQFFPEHSRKKVRSRLAGLLSMAGAVRDRDIALELLKSGGISSRAAVARRLEVERHKAGKDLVVEIRRLKGRDFSRKWRSRLEL